jgi:hypothetical protein
MQEASDENATEIELHVPATPTGSSDNWPWSKSGFATAGLSDFSYTFGITKRPIEVVEVIPDESMNTELGIALPDSN